MFFESALLLSLFNNFNAIIIINKICQNIYRSFQSLYINYKCRQFYMPPIVYAANSGYLQLINAVSYKCR